jgi:hypothetical protein
LSTRTKEWQRAAPGAALDRPAAAALLAVSGAAALGLALLLSGLGGYATRC